MLSYIPSRLKLSTYSFPLFLPQQRLTLDFNCYPIITLFL